ACAASSPSAARSPPGASPAAAPVISASSPALSGARARWRWYPIRASRAREPPMKIILLDDVPKLGRRGEVRDVSDGYARNFLLPHKLALNATAANLKNLDAIKASQESKAAKARSESEEQARALERLAPAPPPPPPARRPRGGATCVGGGARAAPEPSPAQGGRGGGGRRFGGGEP